MGVVKRDVTSLSKSGSTKLKGDVTLSEGTGVSITQTGQDIEIAASGGGSGDVVGPVSATDNGIATFDSTTGKLIKDSTTTLNAGVLYNGSGVDIQATGLSPVSLTSGTTSMGINEDNGSNAAFINAGLDMTTHPIVNVVDPTNDQDAATKKYVDDEIAGIPGGGDVTGPASSVDNAVVLFDSTTGKLIKESGLVVTNGTSPIIESADAMTLVSGTGDININSGFQEVPRFNGVNAVGVSNTQTLTNKTLTTPTIASFANANHNHTNSAGGGQITDAALSGAVGVAKGGTGAVTLTGLLQGNGTSAITGGATINNSNWSGTDLSVANGGTGVSTLTGIVKGNGTSAFSAASAGTDYLAPTGDGSGLTGLTKTQVGLGNVDNTSDATKDAAATTLTNKTLTTPTIAQINNSTAPGVKLQLRTQTDNSNVLADATTAGLIVQYGWGQRIGNGTGTMSETVTFPTAFTTVMGILCAPMGITAADSVPAANAGDFDTTMGAGGNIAVMPTASTGLGFQVELARAGANTFNAARYYGYSWIAWGV